jgi:pyruvate kinase
MSTQRLTKIVVTMGPALDDEKVLQGVIKAGANIFRANFSHGTHEDHQKRIGAARRIAAEQGKIIGILGDLQGPKIRVSRFKNGKVTLEEGQAFILDADLDTNAGDEHSVGIDYKALPQDVEAGDILLLDDGRVVFAVKQIVKNKIHCTVTVGGALSNNKGINRQGGGLSAPALTDKDKVDLIAAIELDVDYIAISFPRSADDMHEAKTLIRQAGGTAKVIAKIERAEAIPVLDSIIEASDGAMVARGDLAVEIGDAEVPAVQKRIISRCRALNKPVITATQMLESMIDNPIPTRAEVSDIANAVLDTTDAVMLSAESATGSYPVQSVEALDRVCKAVEKYPDAHRSNHRSECHFEHVDEAIAMAAMYTANHLNIKAIITLTESGTTPLWMSRIRTTIPIYALSRNQHTLNAMSLYRSVIPYHFDSTAGERKMLNQSIVNELQEHGILEKGDLIIITKGDLIGVHGRTNSLKIFEVGSVEPV